MDSQRGRYPFNEVYIILPKSKIGYMRLDAYNLDPAIKCLKELQDKYVPGIMLANHLDQFMSASTISFEVTERLSTGPHVADMVVEYL